jgi:hypothetical protein
VRHAQRGSAEGMVRAYLVDDKVAGFGVQAVNALLPAATSPRLYHEPELPEFQGLRKLLEQQWVAMLRARVGLSAERLPLLWDCDFMFGESGGFVLCEINVSSVAPFPPSAIAPLVSAAAARLRT